MKRVDAGHLPQHIMDALQDAGIDDKMLDTAVEALEELGVRITIRDNENDETFGLAAYSELHEGEPDTDADGEPVDGEEIDGREDTGKW